MPRVPDARPVGRNKLAQFRHRGSAFAVGLPELRKLVPAYMVATNVSLQGTSPWHLEMEPGRTRVFWAMPYNQAAKYS